MLMGHVAHVVGHFVSTRKIERKVTGLPCLASINEEKKLVVSFC